MDLFRMLKLSLISGLITIFTVFRKKVIHSIIIIKYNTPPPPPEKTGPAHEHVTKGKKMKSQITCFKTNL